MLPVFLSVKRVFLITQEPLEVQRIGLRLRTLKPVNNSPGGVELSALGKRFFISPKLVGFPPDLTMF